MSHKYHSIRQAIEIIIDEVEVIKTFKCRNCVEFTMEQNTTDITDTYNNNLERHLYICLKQKQRYFGSVIQFERK